MEEPIVAYPVSNLSSYFIDNDEYSIQMTLDTNLDLVITCNESSCIYKKFGDIPTKYDNLDSLYDIIEKIHNGDKYSYVNYEYNKEPNKFQMIISFEIKTDLVDINFGYNIDIKQDNEVNFEHNILVLKSWINEIRTEEKNKVLAKDAEEKYNNSIYRTDLSEKERAVINENLRKYRGYERARDNRRRYGVHEPAKIFHQGNHKKPDTPSQFMINFIEATHNLFQIQQKRIEELENVVAELSKGIKKPVIRVKDRIY